MRQHGWIVTCALCAACAGSSSQNGETTEVRNIESAGTMTVVTKDETSPDDKEPVIVSTTEALESEGTQAPTEEMCVPVAVYFEKGSSQLQQQARGQLDRVSECLEDRDKVTIAVIGHNEPRHDKELDPELVAKRTAAVLEYLENKGVDRTYYDVRAGD